MAHRHEHAFNIIFKANLPIKASCNVIMTVEVWHLTMQFCKSLVKFTQFQAIRDPSSNAAVLQFNLHSSRSFFLHFIAVNFPPKNIIQT